MADLERERQAYRILQGFVQRDLDRIKKAVPPPNKIKSPRELARDFASRLRNEEIEGGSL